MTVFNLLTFPNVCRACLQSIHPDQMIELDTHRPELEGTIATFLQDISFMLPTAILPFLPTSVCITCLEVMEFFSKYRRKIKHLHEFLSALAQVKLGDESPLRELFEGKSDQLEILFRDLDLCNKRDAGVNDLLDEYSQYEIASMEVATGQARDEPMEELHLVCSSEEECETTQTKPAKRRRLKIVEVQSFASNDSEEEDAAASDGNEEKQDIPSSKSDGKDNLKQNQLQCKQCSYKTFFTIAHSVHMKKHEQNEGKTGYVCKNPYCLQMFDTAEELMLHKRANPHKVYECEICGSVLKHRISLEVHLERHYGITHFQCSYCSSSFHTKTEQQNHIAAVHISEDRFECDLCGAVFTSNKLLKQHLASHVTERNYHCLECKRSFKTQHHLNRHHKAVHTEVRFQCDYCEISYSRRDKLRMHVERAHQIQTYFVCDICVRSFDTHEALQEHSFRHQHPKHLECAICLIVCLTEADFEKHMCITYQENYVCCGHDFKHHTVYNKHMMRHGIKVNARVKPNTDILIGQERALRAVAESRSSKYCLKSEKPETITPQTYDCMECGDSFSTTLKRKRHKCSVVEVMDDYSIAIIGSNE